MDITLAAGGDTQHGLEILRMPVYSIIEGASLGSINRLYVRDEDHSVPFVQVSQPLFDQHAFVPFSSFRKIGPRVALIDTVEILRDQLSPNSLDGLETDFPGRPVVTQSGEDIGRLLGVSVQEATGKIDHLRVKPSSELFEQVATAGHHLMNIPGDMIVSLANGVVIVQDTTKPTSDQSGRCSQLNSENSGVTHAVVGLDFTGWKRSGSSNSIPCLLMLS